MVGPGGSRGLPSYLNGGPTGAAAFHDGGRAPSAGPNATFANRDIALPAGTVADTGGQPLVGYPPGGYPGYAAPRPGPRRPTADDRGRPLFDPPASASAGRTDAGGRTAVLPPARRGPTAPVADPPISPPVPAPAPAWTPAPASSTAQAVAFGVGAPELDRAGISRQAPDEAGFAGLPHPSPGAGTEPSADGAFGSIQAAQPRTRPGGYQPDIAQPWTQPRGGDPLDQIAPPLSAQEEWASAEMTAALPKVEPESETDPDDDDDDDDDGGWRPSTTVRKRPGREGTAPPRVSSSRNPSAVDPTSATGRAASEARPKTSTGPRTQVAVPRGASRPDDRPGTAADIDLDADLIDDLDEVEDDDEGASGFLARYRRGWVGPLVVAALVSVVAVGLYILFAGKSSGSGTSRNSATPVVRPSGSQTSTTSNPDAAAGQALVDGTYRCYQSGSSDLKPLAPVADKLVVPAGRGVYAWNGQQGTYTIAKNSLSTDAEMFADVQFTGGPLKDVKALFFNRVRQGDAGKDAGSLMFEDGSNRWCAIN
ncbi:hypothetical protein [Frankia sp. Cppng1_Ct_nod]|uniref:hypothetical protein n=1 Tax=Frankia sp. Cppng1_Ct_nod TaxID=2897162 RepID=UPI0010410870|nr:hypothetical protein [Frankia sp. Cppng1_Ct_nod]